MDVVDESVVNASGGERRGELRLPHTLGDPGARRAMAEALFEVVGQTRNLFELVLGRDGDEDRFVKAAPYQFDLAGTDEPLQTSEILRTVLFDPCEERAGIVETHVDAGMFFQELYEREIGVLVGLFEDVAKIADGLVCVDKESEMERFWHGDNSFHKHHNVRRAVSNSGESGKCAKGAL